MVEYKWIVLSNTSLSMLMGSIDANILLIAIPAILRGIQLNTETPGNFIYLLWILFGYGVVTATLLVSFGRLSDIFGRVRLYNLGFAIFAIGSTFLFFVPNTGTLGALEIIIFRIIQGIGGAFLMANGAAIITDAFPINERGKALGINMVVFLAGSLIGLILGGLLSTADLYIPLIFTTLFIPGWRVVFLISVPFGIFGAFWSYWKLKEIGTINRKQHLDIIGNLLFAGGLTILIVSMTYGLVPYGGQSMGWSSPWVIAGIVFSLVLLIIFPFWESRVSDPMFKLGLFKIRMFSMGNLAGILSSITRGGVMIMLIILLQAIWLVLPPTTLAVANTPFWAGIAMMPMALGFVIMGPLSGYLSDRYGSKFFATLGMLITAVSFMGLYYIPAQPSYLNYIIFGSLLFIMGIGGGLFGSPNISSIMSSVPPEYRGVASGMRATLQNTASTMSMLLFFTIIIVGLNNSLPGALRSALVAKGVPTSIINQTLTEISPTTALFSAFLGMDPFATPLKQLNGQTLEGLYKLTPQWFAGVMAGPFMQALQITFLLCIVLSIIAAVVSYSRGKHYYHGMGKQVDLGAPADKANKNTEPIIESGFD